MLDYAKFEIRNINILSFLLCFTLIPFLYTLSGVRNGMAACIEALAIYLYLYKRKNLYIYIILSFIAITFHYAAFLAVPFVFISKRDFSYKLSAVILLSSSILNIIANNMIHWNSTLFNSIASIYLTYSSDNQYWGSNYVLYGVLIIIVLTFFCLLKFKKKEYLQIIYFYLISLLIIRFLFFLISETMIWF